MTAFGYQLAIERTLRETANPPITQARIDDLNARLTPEDIAAVASDWQAVGDDMRAAIEEVKETAS